jgi:hypothetical protein
VSNLATALLIVSGLILVAGVLWNLGARSLDADTRRVTDAETVISPVEQAGPP